MKKLFIIIILSLIFTFLGGCIFNIVIFEDYDFTEEDNRWEKHAESPWIYEKSRKKVKSGDYSLKLTMEPEYKQNHYSGDIWIETPFSIYPGAKVDLEISFSVYDKYVREVTIWDEIKYWVEIGNNFYDSDDFKKKSEDDGWVTYSLATTTEIESEYFYEDKFRAKLGVRAHRLRKPENVLIYLDNIRVSFVEIS